jgi:hypothetical protein
MGMKSYAYIVVGIATNRQECEKRGVNLYEDFDDEDAPVSAVYGETDVVLIGKILHCSDPYGEGVVKALALPDFADVAMSITNAGFGTLPQDVALYVGEFWK